jgi:anti-sigma factor RsiW
VTSDSLENRGHEDMWELIPWLVNGRLPNEAAANVSNHIEDCAQCKLEHAEQLRIYTAMQAGDSLAFAADASFQKLAARLAARAQIPRIGRAVRWAAAASILAALGLGTWGAWSWRSTPATGAGPYLTLTTPARPAGVGSQVRVVFTPNLTLSDLTRLLHSVDAYISDGPTEAGVYTLSFAPNLNSSADTARRLAELRADENVRFAEPVVTAP